MIYVIEISSKSGLFVAYFEREGGMNLIFDLEEQAQDYIQRIETDADYAATYNYRVVPNPNTR